MNQIEISQIIPHCGYAFCGYKATAKGTSRRKNGCVAAPSQDRAVNYFSNIIIALNLGNLIYIVLGRKVGLLLKDKQEIKYD